MKAIFLMAMMGLMALGLTLAREQTWVWDANPPADEVTAYRLLVRPLPTAGQPEQAWREIARTAATEATIEAPDEAFQIAVTALRELPGNTGSIESELSEIVTVPAGLTRPGAPRLRATIELQTSDNLTDWKPVASIIWTDETPGREFLRMEGK